MSFGFGVGDFLAVYDKAQKIRKGFKDAPKQFEGISDEFKSLLGVLRNLDDLDSDGKVLTDTQKVDLKQICHGCNDLLSDLSQTITKNHNLEPQDTAGGKSKRLFRRLKWDAADVVELRQRISSNVSLLTSFYARLTSEDVQNIKGGVEKLVTYQDDEERRKIESWLSPLNPVAQQNDFFARHQDGTGLWILESPQYNAWINGQTRENRTLFCPGIPGAGKTIISSIVVNDVYSRFAPSTNVGVAFLYCNYKTGTRHFAVDLLSSILVQLAHREPSLPDHVRQLYNNHREKPPSIQKIMSALETSVMGLSRLYLIVDALDECADDDRARSQLLAEVFRLQDLTNVSLLATSRPHIQDILDAFDGSPWLEISAQDGDIRAYIAGHMEKLPKSLRKKTGLQEAITTAIISAAKGMFLLAQLHFDSLADKTSLRDVSDALKQLPTGSDALDLAYKGAIERIEGQKPGFKTLAKRVLLWVVHAARHLTVPELQHALAIDCDDTKLDNERIVEVEDIVSVCAGLITVDKELNVLRLVHFTTQKYFEQIGNTWFPKDSHTDIAVASLLYLSYDDFDIMEVLDSQTIYWDYDNFVTDSGSSMEEDRANETEQEKGQLKDPDVGRRDADDEDNSITLWDLKIASKRKLKSMSLVDYAINHWHYHAQRAKEDFVPDVMRAFGSTQKFLSMVKLSYFLTDELSWHIGEQNLKTVSPCHLAAWYGLTKFILHLVAHGFSSTLVDDHNRQPLSWAVKRGYIDTVELLLRQRGTELNLKDAEDEFTPLARATNLGHLAVVNLLLTQSDIEVNCTNSSGTPPLSLAAKERHPEIVQCLLQRKDIDLNVRDNRDMTPLLHAVKEQREDRLVGVKDRQVAAVTFLLEHPEVNVNVQGGYEGRTVLMYAMPIADTQSRHIAELLLDMSKLDMNLRNKKGESVLIFAIWRGRANELSLLLDKRGDDIDLACENYEGKTALAIARDLHHNAELIVRMLYQFASCQKKEEAAKRPRSVRRAGRLMSELNHKGLQKLLDREHDNIDIDREIRWTFFKEKPPSRLDEGETLRAAADRVARDELNKVNILTEFIRRRTATAPDKEGEATKPDQELRFGE